MEISSAGITSSLASFTLYTSKPPMALSKALECLFFDHSGDAANYTVYHEEYRCFPVPGKSQRLPLFANSVSSEISSISSHYSERIRVFSYG